MCLLPLALFLRTPAAPQPASPADGAPVQNAIQQPAVASIPASLEGPSVLTDARGRFSFADLHSASHILRIDPQSLPDGVGKESDRLALTLSPGAAQSLLLAQGLALRAAYHDDGMLLDGAVFRDLDGDGVQAADEPGVPGVRVIDPDVYQYFVPFDDNNLEQSFGDVLVPTGCLPGGPTEPVTTVIDSNVSLTGSSNGTIVYYDHWEDGYDADPITPGPTTVRLTINAGQVQTWRNNIATPRTATPLLFDGRDRITIVGQPLSAVRAAWLTGPGPLLAGAWEMPRVSDWGRQYTIPVGEDLGRGTGVAPFSDYDYVSASIMAAYDGTVVQIDANADGVFERTETINAGASTYVRGSVDPAVISIRSGAKIRSSLPVQVQVRAGNCRAPYSGRSYTLIPVEKWSNDYWSPVSSFASGQNGCTVGYIPAQPNPSADVDIYIANPNPTPLVVNYEQFGSAGQLTVPANTTASYLKLLIQHLGITAAALPRSNIQGVHLTSNQNFWAVTAVDTTSLGNNGADFDWSYSLIPANQLSARVVLSWAPGNANIPPTGGTNPVNGSTVYVQAIADGTIVRADLDGNGTPDNFDINGDSDALDTNAYTYNETTSAAGVTLNRGQMVRISDPNDNDMTGAQIASQDNSHPLAVVFGEDACRAARALPFLDLGYTVLPLPIPEISKNSRLLIDADRSGDISPGDTLEYRVQVFNNGFGPIQQPVLLDTLPFTYTDFIVGSAISNPAPLAPGITYDNGGGTFTYVPAGPAGSTDPQIHAVKANYSILPQGQTIAITMHIKLDNQIPPNVLAITNQASMTSSNTPPVRTEVTSPINQVDLLIHKTDGRTVVNPLYDLLTYTLTYTNAGPGIAHNVVMTDTLPPTAFDVSAPPIPGVVTPTLDLPNGRVIFQLGTLKANQVGQATVSLRLSDKTVSPVVNTVDISTSSHETNYNNNRSVDIDETPPADVLVTKTDGLTQVNPGQQLVYTLTYTNAGPGIAFNSVMTDTLPSTALNATTPTVAGLITPTVDLANKRIVFQLGHLQPNYVNKTTVTITLAPNTPRGTNVVNTVNISSTSRDPNPNNNRHTDIDIVPGTNAVVLAELRAERRDGGVLVSWRTVAEQDNYGFRVYRSRTPDRAGAELITPSIIPGQGRGRAEGASYSFFDTAAPEGALYYWLEAIDLNGTSEFHGPAQPAVQAALIRVFLPGVVVGR
jgi:uncharacterized repeat protein (TIGR01451 family)